MLLNRFNNRFGKTPALVVGVLFFVLAAYTGHAQVQSSVTIDNDFKGHKFAMFDSDGKPFLNPYMDVSGNPFFMEDWKYGIIVLANKSVFGDMQFRLNLKDQQVHFRKPDNTELVINAGEVRQITLLDTVKGVAQANIFMNGFPAVDNLTDKNFYLVLSDGKLKFLKSMRKVIHEDKDVFSGEIKKQFQLYEDYYFFVNGSMERIRKNKEEILEFMADKRKPLDDYLKANKISFKSADDIKKLVDYYNSL